MPWLAVVVCIVFLTSMVANCLVVVVFVAKPSFLTLSNRLVLNLIICNILTSVLIMPCIVVSMTTNVWLLGDVLCQATGFMFSVLVGASNLTLLAISIDRYLAVTSPLLYKIRMTSPRCTTSIMVVWLVSVCAAVPPLLGWNSVSYQDELTLCSVQWSSDLTLDMYYSVFYICLCFILPLAVMLVMYGFIFCAARGNSQRARRNSVIPAPSEDELSSARIEQRRGSGSISTLRRLSSGTIRLGQQLTRKEGWTAAVTSVIVMLSFLVCWSPYFILIAIQTSGAEIVGRTFGVVAIVLAMVNCTCSPVVYVFRSRKNRNVLVQMFQKDTMVQELSGRSDSRRQSVVSDMPTSTVALTQTASPVTQISIVTLPGTSSS